MATNAVKLDRALGFWSTFFVVTGAVIGSGVFLVATDIAVAMPSPGWGLSTWVVAGVISFVGGLVFAELGTRFPDAGGPYVYLKEAFHPLIGFLFGWTLVLVIQAGSIAAVAIAFARFFERGVANPLSHAMMASLTVVALTGINLLGIRKGAAFLDGVTAVKILAIVGLALCGLFFPATSGGAAPAFLPTGASYGVALIAAFWAFDGWNNLGFVAGEVKNARRNIPWALGLGIAAITTLYVLANLTYFKFLSMGEIAQSTFVAADAAKRILGDGGVIIASLFVSLSALGCVNALILTGARVIYAMADDGRLPKGLGLLHPKTRSPNNALIAQMIWSLILVWSGSYDQLFTYVVFAAFIFYGLTAASLFVFRRRTESGEQEIYKMPFYPVLPGLYVVFTAVFCLNSLVERPIESLAGIGLVALGIPAYWYFNRTRPA